MMMREGGVGMSVEKDMECDVIHGGSWICIDTKFE